MSNLQRKDNRKAAIAQIHIGKKQLGLDDETYRALLLRVGKKSSCADMSLSDLYAVIQAMEKQGWKKKRPTRGKYSPTSNKQVNQYIDVMRAYWIEMFKSGVINDGSEAGLTAYAKRMSSQLNGGIGVDTLEWLETDSKLAAKVLECLKRWEKRVWRDWLNADVRTVNVFAAANDMTAADATRILLDEHKIMWHPLFKKIGIEDDVKYLKNRRDLEYV